MNGRGDRNQREEDALKELDRDLKVLNHQLEVLEKELEELRKEGKPDKLHFEDIIQELAGAVVVALTMALSEEIWELATRLSFIHIVLIYLFVLVVANFFVRYGNQKQWARQSILGFIQLRLLTSAILSFVEAGDHILVVDSVYEPTRDFCDKILAKMGVETTYYDPMIGADIVKLIKANTQLIFLESPGSITMEVQDVPAIAKVAHQHNCLVMLDNTWSAGLHFQPFEHGVDISVQAATKYIVGHSDVMLGTATATEKYWPQLRDNSYLLGQCTSPDDLYLALRGLRTLSVRLRQHQQSALTIAKWLMQRPEVETVLHPALSSCAGHEFFQRDFSGSNGLFSFVLNKGTEKAVTALLDGMQHFKMGYSWGGFESLILANHNVQGLRSVTPWPYQHALIRLHIGLEDVDDLIADLAQGFERLNYYC